MLCGALFVGSAVASGWKLPPESTAVVTGGTKGIGHAIVTELASQHSCRVLTCGRNQEELNKCLEEWHSRELNVEGVVADVSTKEGRDGLVRDIEKFLNGKRLDILVNNVGTNIRKPSIEYTPEEVQHILDTNYLSMFHLTTALHDLLKRKTASSFSSSVVNVGSVAGVTCMKSGTPYASTKAAMNQLTGNWACEWGPDGIRVNCVAPWYINTALAQQVLEDENYKRCVVLSEKPMCHVTKFSDLVSCDSLSLLRLLVSSLEKDRFGTDSFGTRWRTGGGCRIGGILVFTDCGIHYWSSDFCRWGFYKERLL